MDRDRLIARLTKRKRVLGKKRQRQLSLFKSTRRRQQARKAADYGHRMQKLQDRIEELERAPKNVWKLEYATRFIAPWEGLRTAAYQDSGGIWTIGYGHTGKYAYPGNTISKAFALVLLTADLRSASGAVTRNVKVPLTFRERIAAISFTFNVGEGGLQSSTFLRKLNEGKRREAANALLLWVQDAQGNVLLGLQRRRRAERWLFLNPRS